VVSFFYWYIACKTEQVIKRKAFWRESGEGNMVLATFCFAVMGVLTRQLGERYPSVELVFFRNLTGFLLVLVSVIRRPLVQEGGRTGLLVFRGFIGATSLFAFYYCLTQMQLALANTYNLTYPLFIGLLSALFLRRFISFGQLSMLLLGFAGVLLIFRPDLDYPLKLHLIGLYSGIGTSLGYLSIAGLSRFYDQRAILLSFLTGGLILSGISVGLSPFFQDPALDFLLAPFVWPTGLDWLPLLAMAVIALVGQTFVTRAFSLGKPAVVGTLNFLQIPLAWIGGLILGDAAYDAYTLLGIIFVLSSGVGITLLSSSGEKESA